MFKTVEKVWPTDLIKSGDRDILVTEYATKNVEELFAEAVANFYYGNLPDKIKELVEDSLQ
jgi:hypothetical protein